MSALPTGAAAVTVLSSEPLKGGPGGLVCSCTNLTGEQIVVDFQLLHSTGGSACGSLNLSPGGFPEQCSVSSPLVRICRVLRHDGQSASTKQIVCTLASLDAAGNPTVVVPVDKKLKQ